VGRAQAGDTRVEFVPEANAYLKLSDHARLFLLGSLTQGLSEPFTDGEVGVHLDLTLTPILRRRLANADWERDRYLWVRIGYALWTVSSRRASATGWEPSGNSRWVG